MNTASSPVRKLRGTMPPFDLDAVERRAPALSSTGAVGTAHRIGRARRYPLLPG